MKKYLGVLLAFLLMLLLCACGKTEANQEGKLPISAMMQPIFRGDTVLNETVMFVDYEDAKSLLYTPSKIVKVTSYGGDIVYEEGKDYELRDGKLVLLEGSSIPCITGNKYYNMPGSIITNTEGKHLYWGEADAMTKYQVCVDYIHSDSWEGYQQVCYAHRYKAFLEKLEKGQDVTVYFYGDSITTGSNSSFKVGVAPHQYPYYILFLQTVAEIYDYTVDFVSTDSGARMPEADLVCGDRGVISCMNTSMGGWSVGQGIDYFETHVAPNIKDGYGCDLFVLAFGMNDKNMPGDLQAESQEMIMDMVLDVAPQTAFMTVSTMVPHPDTSWDDGQERQESSLMKLADKMNEKGVPCAVAGVSSMSLSLLEQKDFMDISGNNVNHPNDFLSRVYAQTMIQTLIGYENIN